MDDFEKTFKRLAIIFVASLVVIFIAKAMLSKAATHVGKAAEIKKQQNAEKQAAQQAAAVSAAAEANSDVNPSPVPDAPVLTNNPVPETAVVESAPAASTASAVQ